MENILLEDWRNKYLELEEKHHALENKTVELETLVKYYEEQFRLAAHKKYGASSEKTEHTNQLLLFDEAENEANPRQPEPTVEEIRYTRRKSAGKREEDLSEFPVKTLEYSEPEEERVCPECGGAMHVMGHDTRRELEIIPAQVQVVEHVSEVYSCRRCEREGTSVPVRKAPSPNPVIKGSLAGASSVAHIMVCKYMSALPLYRQEQVFQMNGVQLSRQTMANWMLRCSEDWLEPLYEHMRVQLLEEGVLHADETVLQVLKEPGRASRTQSFMWLYRTSGVRKAPVVLYEYQPTRSGAHPKRFLERFKGYLHTDGYSVYHSLSPDIHAVGCWAHARRKFDEALKAAPPDERGVPSLQKGLGYCNRLFELERDYKNLQPEERYKERLSRSKPVSDEFFAWAASVIVLPKSTLGKAIHYALEQKEYLERVFVDGRLELSNNRAERSIKPFVIGRKNWLFSCTPKGAKTSSVIYSIIETAKENGLKPFEYLKHIFETLPNIPADSYASLLPWSETIPDICKQSPLPDKGQSNISSS